MESLSNSFLFTLEFLRTGYARLLTSNSMIHSEIIDTMLGQRYRETIKLGYQCVAWAKKYAEMRWWITWLSFWWTAYNWFLGKGNLYTHFDKVNDPQEWDYVFYEPISWINPEGHISIYDRVCETIAQNEYGSASGVGQDAISRIKSSRKIIWYLRPKIAKPVQKMNTHPTNFRVFNQNLNTTTLNACTFFSAIHMMIWNNVVKDTIWVDEKWIAKFCQEMIAQWILTPVGSNVMDVLAYFVLKLKKRKIHTFRTKEDTEDALNKWYACMCIVDTSTIADSGTDGVMDWEVVETKMEYAHMIIVTKEDGRYYGYDSLAQHNKYEITKFYLRFGKQIWSTLWTIY